MLKLNGYWSNWTLPYRLSRNTETYQQPLYEVLTFLLSVLQWKKQGHKALFYTDQAGYRFYEKIGLLGIFDSVDRSELEALSKLDGLYPLQFANYGKLLVYSKMLPNSAHIDMDAIVWSVPEITTDIVVAYVENSSFSADLIEGLAKPPNYVRPPYYTTKIANYNACYYYFRKPEHTKLYFEEATKFVLYNNDPNDIGHRWVYSEQYYLSMLAKYYNWSVASLVDISKPEEKSILTHLWGYKSLLAKDPQEQAKYLNRIVNRLQQYDISSVEPSNDPQIYFKKLLDYYKTAPVKESYTLTIYDYFNGTRSRIS